jgi:hypothetical protein
MLLVDISINGRTHLARYGIRRLTNTDSTKPVGTVNRYAITKVVEGAHEEWEFVGYVNHAYNDKAERLVELAMQKILEVE